MNILLFCYHGNIPGNNHNDLNMFCMPLFSPKQITKVKTFATIAIFYIIISSKSPLKMDLEKNALSPARLPYPTFGH